MTQKQTLPVAASARASQPPLLSYTGMLLPSKEHPELVDMMIPSEVTTAAEQLTAQWANLRPDNPRLFGAAVAKVLGQYPRLVVMKCIDPTRGLAKTCDFFSIQRLTAWCEEERRYLHLTLENRARPPREEPKQIPASPEMREKVGVMLRGLATGLGDRLRLALYGQTKETLDAANAAALAKEHANAGTQPEHELAPSPYLRKLLADAAPREPA